MIGDVAVVIVNYGTSDLVIKSVESVFARAHGGRRVEVHVVDNASPNDDGERLAEAFAERGWTPPRLTLWRETENRGFGCGNNVALEALAKRETPPHYVFLLNSDAWLENEAISILADALDADPQAVAAGSGISQGDGTPATAAFRFPSMSSEVARTIGIGFVERLLRYSKVALPPDHPKGRVDWVSGAAVMFRFDALARQAFFDPVYFLYFEEVDLMRRLTRAGGRVIYVPQARVIHLEGVSTSVRTGHIARRKRPNYVYRSWRHYFRRQHGWTYAMTTAVLVFLAGCIHVAASSLRRKPVGLPAAFLRDHWRYALRPLLSGSE